MNAPANFQREMNYTALFVDFDNVYITLSQHDNEAATQFATNPARWLRWMETQLAYPYPAPLVPERRILIRRCYLNPQSFGRFRPDFTHSAFEVIDCPPLTARGKTSTDIHMVMDILDALNAPTYINQFIILSGDADFTPVLLRIRKQGRYTAALSVGYVSPAYKAACDTVISQEDFVRNALGLRYQDEDAAAPLDEKEISESLRPLLDRIAARLADKASVPGGIEASELPEIYKEFSEFRQSNHWLGFYSLRRLTQAVISRRNELSIVEDDPWRVIAAPPPAPVVIAQPAQALTSPSPSLANANIKTALAEWIKETVYASPTAVPMAALAQGVRERFREDLTDTNWLGFETFKGMLSQLDLGRLLISSAAAGFVLDPTCHQLSGLASSAAERDATAEKADEPDIFAMRYPELAPLARRVHQLTDTPYLLPEHYALLFQELAREITDNGYQLTRVSKTVRDRCVERGASIARSHVNFVLFGIGYTGYRFGRELPEDPVRLSQALIQNIVGLCRNAQLDLSDVETASIRQWIAGGLPQPLVKLPAAA